MRDNGDDYSNPYGDLQASKRQHSTADYGIDEESSEGLIDKSRTTNVENEGDTELARAVVDLLSCCTGSLNTNQSKILQDMQGRFSEKGNLLEDIEGGSDTFDDEYSKARSERNKFSPRQWIRNIQPKVEAPIPTERPFIRALPEKKTQPNPIALMTKCALACIILILVFLGVAILSQLELSSNDGEFHHVDSKHGLSTPTADCALVAKQKRPNPLSQCECAGSITKITSESIDRYDYLKKAFGEKYLQNNETMSSCSSRNQALMWLAEDSGSIHSEILVQRHSLALFYIKMRGIHWTLDDKQKWMTSDHECTWFGVACNEDKEVVLLELWNVNLDGSIPKELMSLTSLQRLSLPENRIHGHLPTETFKFMSKLTDLTLFMNSLSGNIPPGMFDAVTALKTLNLDSNDMTGTIPTNIGQLSSLETMKFARNYLEGTLPTEVGNLKLLQRMELEENNLEGQICSELGKLYLLDTLDFSWNSFYGTIPWELQDLRNLKNVFLKSNSFSGSLPNFMVVWGKLENLVLSLNAFTGALPSGMYHLTSLETLHLDGNKFSGTIPADLASCTELRDLKLGFNDFHGVVPAEIGQLKWLVSMSLEGNILSGSMPNAVCKLRNGEFGSLQTLSATCTDDALETQSDRNKEVFKSHNDLVCSVPDCCTSCSRR